MIEKLLKNIPDNIVEWVWVGGCVPVDLLRMTIITIAMSAQHSRHRFLDRRNGDDDEYGYDTDTIKLVQY